MLKYKIKKKEELHYLKASDVHPADTYFHFSFANYFDPDNMNFGALRVINDDKVIPNGGFSTHPHQNMEIFSYVVDGELTHRDSAGNHEKLTRGHVQAITAGSGVSHSELNEIDKWCRFLQIWVMTNKENLPVSYTLHKFTPEERENKLLQIISSTSNRDAAPLNINQDINVFVSELTDKEVRTSFSLKNGRQAYLYNFEGSIKINDDTVLDEMDSLKVWDEAEINIKLESEHAHFIIIEIAKAD